jgi:hypothetical protein
MRSKIIIRSKDFRAWFKTNLKEEAQDIAEHGADCGFPYITYTSDTVDIYNKFESEIWEELSQDAEEFGHKSVAEFVGTFRRNDMANDPDQFKNLLVWYMCEKVAHELSE